MDIWQLIGLGIAAIAGGFTALAKVYKWGPFLDRIEPMPSLDREPLEEPYIPASPIVIAPSTPKPPLEPVSSPTSVNPTLTQICTYMRDFEGKPGDANYRNNNPLNAKFYDPKQTGTDAEYLPKYRPVKCSPSGFAVFKDSATGWLYGFNMIKNKIQKHPNWTLLDMISDHAPASENQPVVYATNIAKRAKIDIHYPLKNLLLV